MKNQKTLQSVIKEYKRFFGEYPTEEELKYIKKEFQSKTKNQIIDELTSKLLTNINKNNMTSTKEYIELQNASDREVKLFESIATRLGHLNNNGLETMTEFGSRYYCDDLQDVKDLTDICKVLNISFTTGTEVLT